MYFIPVDGTPIEVSEEIYRAYYQPIWNTRYHAQKNGECRCTKAQLWKCDGVCPGCPFYAAGNLHEVFPDAEINPLGDWTGGTDVDSGATNRKLGSDMGDSVTGGGLHGKDLSKADVVPFGQGFKDMSPPTKELMKLVLEQKIAHGGHPVLRWMMDNIFIRTDPAGNIKPDKEKSTEKIDGAVATIMALDRAIRCGNDNGASVYDSRGLLFI